MTKYTDAKPKAVPHAQPKPRLNLTDDELFLLIDDNGGPAEDADDSGVHVEYRQYLLNKKLSMALEAKRSKQLRVEETPRRRRQRDHGKNGLRKNTLNRRLFDYLLTDNEPPLPTGASATPKAFDGIRFEIAIRMADMNRLIMHEEQLMDQLDEQCDQYRNLNQIYTRKLELEMCIEEVQRKLDAFAKDIIRIEMELFHVKHEIHQKCGILHNLQRMLQTDSDDDFLMTGDYDRILRSVRGGAKATSSPKKFYETSFSDGSFGPCDNSANKSLII